ncbi:MAG TPA: ribonuclease III [bacterium]|nr:ribonuclease III [bacterium]
MQETNLFEEILKIKFNNQDLLKQALIHRSYLNEHADFALGHNERLEFLGDAVLELIVTENLYQNYPNPEGEMTNWRASLVNAKMLAEIAHSLNVEKFLFLSKGEAKDKNPKARNYILANAMEAVIGAIYLDQGFEVVKKFILENIVIKLPAILANKSYVDAKSRFQEMAQEETGVTPSYIVLEESGPDHNKKFIIGVYLEDELIAKGEGTSKQEAQMAAAEEGLKVKNW